MKTIPIRRGFTEIRKIFELLHGHGIIAGGYARYCASPSRKPIVSNDVDIFPLHKEVDFEILKDKFLSLGFIKRTENDVSFTFNHSPIGWEEVPIIQLIKPNDMAKILTYGEPKDIINNFDFTVTRAAIISSENVLVDDDFEEDEFNKMLVIKNIHCPISSLLRCMKYSRKGYFLKPIEATKLFSDWMGREESYRNKINNFMLESVKFNPLDPSSSNLSKGDVEELEKMMMLD